MPTPLELFKSRLTFITDDAFQSRDVVEKGALVGRDSFNAFLFVYQNLRGTSSQQDVLVQLIRESWAEYGKPLDLPVGKVIEGIIDNYLPELVAGLIPMLDAWLDKKLPNPVPPA